MLKKFKFILLISIFLTLCFATYSFALSPTDNNIYEGIDVSNWQGYIDYRFVKEAGIEIVYIKSSQGTNIIDPYFRTNYNNAKANGLKVGFYHYLVARTEEEAIQEAEYFSSVISGTSPDCKLAMDFESFGNLNTQQINEISKVFLEKTKELTGKDLIIYSDAYNAKNIFSIELANTYPLWIAEYGVEIPTSNVNWNNWTRISIYKYGKNWWYQRFC